MRWRPLALAVVAGVVAVAAWEAWRTEGRAMPGPNAWATAEAQARSGDLPAAERTLRALAAREPTADVLAFHGVVLRELERTDAAVAELEAALARDPDHGPAHLYLAMIHHDAGRWAEAEAHARAHLRVAEPGIPQRALSDLYLCRAMQHRLVGAGLTGPEIDEMLGACDRFLERGPGPPLDRPIRAFVDRARANRPVDRGAVWKPTPEEAGLEGAAE